MKICRLWIKTEKADSGFGTLNHTLLKILMNKFEKIEAQLLKIFQYLTKNWGLTKYSQHRNITNQLYRGGEKNHAIKLI